MSNKLYGYRKSNKLTDFIIRIPDINQDIHVHLLILCINCPYFERMYDAGMKEIELGIIEMNVSNGYVLVDYLNSLYDETTNVGNLPRWQHLLETIILKNMLDIEYMGEMKELLTMEIPDEALNLLFHAMEIVDHPLMRAIARLYQNRIENYNFDVKNNYLIVNFRTYLDVYVQIKDAEFFLLKKLDTKFLHYTMDDYIFIWNSVWTISKIKLPYFEEERLTTERSHGHQIITYRETPDKKHYVIVDSAVDEDSMRYPIYLCNKKLEPLKTIESYSVHDMIFSNNGKYLLAFNNFEMNLISMDNFEFIAKYGMTRSRSGPVKILKVLNDGTFYYFRDSVLVKNSHGHEIIIARLDGRVVDFDMKLCYTYGEEYLIILQRSWITILDRNFEEVTEYCLRRPGVEYIASVPGEKTKILIGGSSCLNYFDILTSESKRIDIILAEHDLHIFSSKISNVAMIYC